MKAVERNRVNIVNALLANGADKDLQNQVVTIVSLSLLYNESWQLSTFVRGHSQKGTKDICASIEIERYMWKLLFPFPRYVDHMNGIFTVFWILVVHATRRCRTGTQQWWRGVPSVSSTSCKRYFLRTQISILRTRYENVWRTWTRCGAGSSPSGWPNKMETCYSVWCFMCTGYFMFLVLLCRFAFRARALISFDFTTVALLNARLFPSRVYIPLPLNIPGRRHCIDRSCEGRGYRSGNCSARQRREYGCDKSCTISLMMCGCTSATARSTSTSMVLQC